MGFLAGKKILVTGLLSNRSIAWGIARSAQRSSARLSYQNERFRTRPRTWHATGGAITLPCEVSEDARSTPVRGLKHGRPGRASPLHRVRPAKRSPESSSTAIATPSASRTDSAYSFPALAKAALPMMEGRAGAMLTLTYLGAERQIPHYNTMGLAKASLEASVRYLAANLGPKGIRVNAISAGPIKTLAAAGIAGFSKIFKFVEVVAAPQREHRRRRQCGCVSALGSHPAYRRDRACRRRVQCRDLRTVWRRGGKPVRNWLIAAALAFVPLTHAEDAFEEKK